MREDSRDSGQGEDRGEGGGQAHTRDPLDLLHWLQLY